MKKPIGLVLATLIWVAGCNQPQTEDKPNGGGGGQPAPAVVDVQRARDRIGKAYVHSAQVHADVVRGDYDGAIAAVRDLRNELNQAKQAGRLETQTRLNELDQQAIRVQREIERRSLTSYQSAEKLVDQLQGLLASVPPQPITGGGGGGAQEQIPGSRPVPEEHMASPALEPLVLP